MCARQDHVSYVYTRTDLNRLAMGQVHAVELEVETIEDDHATLAPRLDTRAASEAAAGGEDFARVERAVTRDSAAELYDGEHADERLDPTRGGDSPETPPDLLARKCRLGCGGRRRVQKPCQEADVRRIRGRHLETCSHAPVCGVACMSG
jgi:hypothetical protein